jgi:hypothetical protein
LAWRRKTLYVPCHNELQCVLYVLKYSVCIMCVVLTWCYKAITNTFDTHIIPVFKHRLYPLKVHAVDHAESACVRKEVVAVVTAVAVAAALVSTYYIQRLLSAAAQPAARYWLQGVQSSVSSTVVHVYSAANVYTASYEPTPQCTIHSSNCINTLVQELRYLSIHTASSV